MKKHKQNKIGNKGLVIFLLNQFFLRSHTRNDIVAKEFEDTQIF